MPRNANPDPLTTGELLLGGDWACAHGDIEGLCYVIEALSVRTSGELKTELTELAKLCHRGDDGAWQQWPVLRRRLVT